MACNVFLYQEYYKPSLLVSSVNSETTVIENQKNIAIAEVNEQAFAPTQLASSAVKPAVKPIPLKPVESKQVAFQSDNLDYDAVDESVSQLLFSDDQIERERAIKRLAGLSSETMKISLYEIINNPDEDLGVRITSIESLNWKDNAQALLAVYDFNQQSPEIKLSVIYTANDIPFNEEDKLIIEEKFLSAFQEESDTSVRIAFADYFSQHNPDRLRELADMLLEQEDVPVALSEYFNHYNLS